MRRFSVLDKNAQMELREKFPDLDKLVAVEDTSEYTYMAVSVFDRWLGHDDALKILSDVSEEEQRERDSKFIKFAENLVSNTEILNFSPLRSVGGVYFISSHQQLIEAVEEIANTKDQIRERPKDFFYINKDLLLWKQLLPES